MRVQVFKCMPPICCYMLYMYLYLHEIRFTFELVSNGFSDYCSKI